MPVAMKTIIESFSFRTSRPRAEVHALLDDLPSHERFTDHFFVDWEQISPQRTGVGAAVRMRAKGAGRHNKVEITVVEAGEDRIVEHGRGGKNLKRRSTGTYELEPTGDGGTQVTFTNTIDLEGVEQLQAPIMRWYLKRINTKAMDRLRDMLEQGA
jgi:hypothetical protein